MKKSILATSLAAAILGLPAVAVAQGAYGSGYERDAPRYEGRSVQTRPQYDNDHSGTAGRMGLGASPAHPEGPGNVIAPAR